MHVTPPPTDELTGHMADVHARELTARGYVPNHTRLFSLNPDAFAAWEGLSLSIRKRMRLRRYELATLAAAAALGCRYCVSAHAAIVIGAGLFAREDVETILRDRRSAGLEPVELAIMDLAEQVALDASKVTGTHIDTLRAHGLPDAEIFDIALAAAARSFFSKALDSMGAEPDAGLADTNDLIDVVRSSAPGRAAQMRRCA